VPFKDQGRLVEPWILQL